nr:DUF3892 domain-containing protein [Bradyrhizobium yuanmingense]
MERTVDLASFNKTDIKKPHERITHVGGVNPDGKPWKRSIDEVVRDIERRRMGVLCQRKWTQGWCG